MKLVAALVLLGLVASGSAVSFFSVVLEEWEAFKLEHGKKYQNEVEEQFRLKIFRDNKYKVAQHNKMYHRGEKSYSMKINHFADLLHHEFCDMMNGYHHNKSRSRLGATFIGPDNDIVLPKTMDWRTKGAVTPVKNQGECGSCWSFSATGALEGQHFRKTGKLISLSEQNLIDCSTKFGNNGCNGGLMDYAFEYVKSNGGIDTEDTYPYEAMDDKCRYNPDDSGADDRGYVDVREGNEHALKKAIATVGPVAVAIDASHESFQFYSEGVYYEPDCDTDMLDHGVLAVGYGSTDQGEEYWLVKNSWSEKWGDEGYIKMSRNRDNNCGIASAASFPLV